MSQVRADLAPWEAQMAEVQSRMDVATSERDLLLQQQQDAKGECQQAAQGLCASRHACLVALNSYCAAVGLVEGWLAVVLLGMAATACRHTHLTYPETSSQTHFDAGTCCVGRLAAAKEALTAAKQVAAEQEQEISQIEQDLQQQRYVHCAARSESVERSCSPT